MRAKQIPAPHTVFMPSLTACVNIECTHLIIAGTGFDRTSNVLTALIVRSSDSNGKSQGGIHESTFSDPGRLTLTYYTNMDPSFKQASKPTRRMERIQESDSVLRLCDMSEIKGQI